MTALPGLRGDDPLGVLAALGLLALSEQGLLPRLRLSWTAEASPLAEVEGAGLRELEEAVTQAFRTLDSGEGVLPGADPAMPMAKKGTKGSDPMRRQPSSTRALFRSAVERARSHDDPWTGRWLMALSGQTVTREEGDTFLTPFYAPTGQMTLRGSLFDLVAQGVRGIDGPADALSRWRRTPAFKGANFDHRAVRDAVTSPNGEASNLGAPSPTWLAVMAIRLFPMVERGRQALTVGWQPVRLSAGATARSLVWPTWSPALDAAAVAVLLAHPALRLLRSGSEWRPSHPDQLEGLGVHGVFGSSRRTLSQGDGPLGPAVTLWRAGFGAPVRGR